MHIRMLNKQKSFQFWGLFLSLYFQNNVEMKLKIFFLSFFLSVIQLYAQNEYLEKFAEESDYNIKVSPNGDVFLHDNMPSSCLLKINFANNTVEEYTFQSKKLLAEDILFLSKNEWFVYNKESPCFYSKDAGKTWKEVYYPHNESYWFFAAQSNKTIWFFYEIGRAIYYTSDLGKTWKEHSGFRLKNEEDYPLFIQFDSKGENGLLFTGDSYKLYAIKNGKKELGKNIDLPTSIDKIELDGPLHQIEIGNQFYIISIDQKVYHTSKENIAWKELPKAVEFKKSLDDEILTKNEDGSFSLYNNLFQKKAHYEGAWIDSVFVLSYSFINDTIYIHGHEDFYKITPTSVQKISIYRKNTDIYLPQEQIFETESSENIAFKRNEIFKKDDELNKWKRVKKLPFRISNMNFLHNNLIIQEKINVFYKVNEKDFSLNPYLLPDTLIDNFVVQRFWREERGSQYFPNKIVSGDLDFEKESKQRIIKRIIEILNNYKEETYYLSSFTFTNEEISEYWKQFKENTYPFFTHNLIIPKNNISLISERIKNIKQQDVEAIFIYSETSDNIRINVDASTRYLNLQLENNTRVEIFSSKWKPRSYLQNPWMFKVNEFVFTIHSSELPNLMNQLFEESFFHPLYTDKYLFFVNCVDYFSSETD